MTERERLIELLKESEKKVSEIFSEPLEIEEWLGVYADYLLENNVKPLPFKINDVVYGISRGKIIPLTIEAIQHTGNGVDFYGSNEEYFGYSTVHLDINNQIGMKWYKTKEEAEKASERDGK